MLSFNEFNFMAKIGMVFIIFWVNNVPFASFLGKYNESILISIVSVPSGHQSGVQ